MTFLLPLVKNVHKTAEGRVDSSNNTLMTKVDKKGREHCDSMRAQGKRQLPSQMMIGTDPNVSEQVNFPSKKVELKNKWDSFFNKIVENIFNR